jgi:recombination DNA repair RAD52 pathway protein
MAFTNPQAHELKAKLDPKHVKTRKANGATLHYVEGWHVIAEANRIFGHDGWDRKTVATACVCPVQLGSIIPQPTPRRCA